MLIYTCIYTHNKKRTQIDDLNFYLKKLLKSESTK